MINQRLLDFINRTPTLTTANCIEETHPSSNHFFCWGRCRHYSIVTSHHHSGSRSLCVIPVNPLLQRCCWYSFFYQNRSIIMPIDCQWSIDHFPGAQKMPRIAHSTRLLSSRTSQTPAAAAEPARWSSPAARAGPLFDKFSISSSSFFSHIP